MNKNKTQVQFLVRFESDVLKDRVQVIDFIYLRGVDLKMNQESTEKQK